MAACSEDFLCRDEFDAISPNYRSHGYGADTSEANEKIITDEKDYHR